MDEIVANAHKICDMMSGAKVSSERATLHGVTPCCAAAHSDALPRRDALLRLCWRTLRRSRCAACCVRALARRCKQRQR
jgi:hypothetical protein